MVQWVPVKSVVVVALGLGRTGLGSSLEHVPQVSSAPALRDQDEYGKALYLSLCNWVRGNRNTLFS